MMPRLLPIPMTALLFLLTGSLALADSHEWFRPTWSPGASGRVARVQFAEELPDLPGDVPKAPSFGNLNPPVTVAPGNSFPETSVDSGEPSYGEIDDQKPAQDYGSGVFSEEVTIDSPMQIGPSGEVLDGLDGSLDVILPNKVCNCEICRLKRAGYKVIDYKETPAPVIGRHIHTRCVAPGNCSVCEALNQPVIPSSDRPGGCVLGGWLAWGWYGNSHGQKGQLGNLPLGFNNIAEQIQLHQAWLYAEREADNEGEGFAWGYRIDFMFGSDGPDTQAFNDESWDGSWDTSSQYGFAMPQLYFRASWQDWGVTIGRYFTIIGYETVPAPDNFFYSHAYTMYYNEPFTHTGFLFDRPLGENWTLYAGWTAGWDNGYKNRFGGSTFLGGLTYSPSDQVALTYTTSIGDPGADLPGANDVYMHTLVMDLAFGRGWNYVLQADAQFRETDAALAPGVFNSKQYGVNQYLIRKLNCRWSAGVRMETFYSGEGNGPPLNPPIATPGSHFNAITFGLNYRPSASIVVKPEMRYDWVDSDGPPGGPFDLGTRRSQMTVGVQTVWTF